MNISNDLPCPENEEDTLDPVTTVPPEGIADAVADTGFPILFAFTSTLIGHPVKNYI